MKRLALTFGVAAGLMLLTIGCEETNPDKINSEGITGIKPENAPTQQGKNAGTEKAKPAGAPGGGAPGGMTKNSAAAFPAQAGPIRPDQIPSNYPRPGGEAKLKDGTTVKIEGRDGTTPAGDEKAADAPKEGGEADKSAMLGTKEREQIAKLPSEADQKLAIAQAVCLISGDSLLGSMGVPVRVEHEGKVGFLCCKGCKADFDADPAKALAKVAK